MLEWLLALDKEIFLFINITLANPVTDFIMPVVTNDWALRIVYAMTIICLLAFGRLKFIYVALFSIFVVILSDQSSAAWIKPAVERLRPCKTLAVHLLVNCGSGWSFPSSHAANLFAQAVFFGALYRKYLWYFIAFASLVALSRVFVGVHYPIDITAGAILGSAIGLFFAWLLLRFHKRGVLRPGQYIRDK